MYLDFYHLKEEPFLLTPDPRFLQLPEPHRNALAALAQGVDRRKGLMTLTGPIGTGKTTLIHGLLSALARQHRQKTYPTALIVNPRLSREELLETLLFEFEIHCAFQSKPYRLAALQGLMFAASKAGASCVLIVDEAHLLTADLLEEIRLLMNADSYREKLLQVVLCGQLELTDLLNQPSLRAFDQRIAVRTTLRELSRSETRIYIFERLRIAGFERSNPFSSSAIEKIYAYTAGVPRLINIVCDSSLAIGCETKRQTIDEDIIEEAAARNALDRSASEVARPEVTVLPLLSPSLRTTNIVSGGEP